MDEELYSIIYASSAIRLFTRDELLELLTTAKERNSKRGITGLLLYKGGNFIQAIEGLESDVKTLYEKIQKDHRHENIITLGSQAINERQFPDWTMGFRNIDDLSKTQLEGYSRFLEADFTPEYFRDNPLRAYIMLQNFKESM